MEVSPVVDPSPPQLSDGRTTSARRFERVSVLGVPVDRADRRQTLAFITAAIEQAHAPTGAPRPTHQVVTLNPEIVMCARQDPGVLHTIGQADLVVPDGVGVVWAARALGVPLRERVTGVDLLESVAAVAAEQGWRIFLLGAAPGVADEAAGRLSVRFTGLRIAGTLSSSPNPADQAACVERIRSSGADVVFVAFGAPAQERWIARTRGQLGAAVAVGIGGAFDFVSGRAPRAPRWMRAVGLEWLYRLLRQPWRWRRMLALPRFAAGVAIERCRLWARWPSGVGAHHGRY